MYIIVNFFKIVFFSCVFVKALSILKKKKKI